MTNMGLLAALAGMVTAARLTAANPKAGTTSSSTRSPRPSSAAPPSPAVSAPWSARIIGGFVMGVLNNGMSLMGVSIDWQQAVKGLVLLAAVAFDVWNKKRTSVGGGAGAEDTAATAPPPEELVEEIEHAEAPNKADLTRARHHPAPPEHPGAPRPGVLVRPASPNRPVGPLPLGRRREQGRDMDDLDFTGLRALFINCTLKRSPGAQPHPGARRRQRRDHAQARRRGRGRPGRRPRHRHRRLPRHDASTAGRPTPWPEHLPRVLAADILVIAGPIWLGDNSSA